MSPLINKQSPDALRIGIDATNIRIGGGITHLLELLNAIDAKAMGVQEVVIWAGSKTLQSLVSDITTSIKSTPSFITNPEYRVRGFWAIPEPRQTLHGLQHVLGEVAPGTAFKRHPI